MKISVVIPIYNVEQEISRCLLSVLNQDYSDIEIVLVNDSTPDDSYIIAKKIVQEYDSEHLVKYVEHSVNRGLSAARNSGIKESTGDYIFFLDSDDALNGVSVFTDLLQLATNKDHGFNQVVIGNFQQISEETVIQIGFQQDLTLSNSLDVYKAYAEGQLAITAWGKLVLREFIVKNNLFFKEGIYHEDELWSYYLFKASSDVRTTSQIVCNYYQRAGSISFEIKEKNVLDLNIVIEEMYEEFLHDSNAYAPYTALKIEKLKRRSLKWCSHFNEKFICKELTALAKINTKGISGNKKLIAQNFIFKFPNKIAAYYLKLRWGNK